MGNGLENKIMDSKISFSIKDLKWVITTAITSIALIVTIILWLKDRDKVDKLGTRVTELVEINSTLKNQVATLEGKVTGVSEASKIFMENSPSENRYRIEILENRVDRLELPGSNAPLAIINPTTLINSSDTSRRRNH